MDIPTSPAISTPVVIIGAGPAGLSASYQLAKNGISSVVLEKDNAVGGISRTVEYKGYLFDIGGHRFFTKVAIVQRMWEEVLGEDFLVRPRLSRIFYGGKFFQYPLEPWNAVRGLGIWESLRCGLSLFAARLKPIRPEESFEDWVSNRFGCRLFRLFFESYTEKVWGISCKQIRAEWAAQRIKDLSLTAILRSAFIPGSRAKTVKTLIGQFHYPRRGPGMMWQRTRELVEAAGSRVELNAAVEKIFWEPGRVTAVQAAGRLYQGDHFISSLPIRELIGKLSPAPPEKLLRAAADFNYRDFLTVALIVKQPDLFPDNWIYIHEASLKVGRIQNFKNWSPDMVPDPAASCLGLEYFCFEGDGLWSMPDAGLIALARQELAALGLAAAEDIVDGCVVRMPKAYPVYDDKYLHGIAAIREFLAATPNLQLVGRNGMHRYNNQDHSMLTAILAARNIAAGEQKFDLWKVNADEDYHEGAPSAASADLAALQSTQPLVPRQF